MSPSAAAPIAPVHPLPGRPPGTPLTDPLTDPLVASQWDDALTQRLRQAGVPPHLAELPPGVDGLAGLAALRDARGRPAQVLLARPFSAADRQRPPPEGWPFALRFVQLVSVGTDHYPPWLLHTPGLPVATAHGTSSAVIAEFVLAQLLRVALRLDERRAHSPEDWRLRPAPALAGSRLGLVGFGGIGQALAQRALALGLQVRALRRSDAPLPLAGVQRARDVAELAAWADHLVLAAPGGADTRHLIDARVLAGVRPGLHLVNVARGSLLDTEALRTALDDGRVGWASLDVTDPEPLPAGHWLYQHPRVWLTPHTCAISPQVQQALVQRVDEALQALAAGQQPAHRLDRAA